MKKLLVTLLLAGTVSVMAACGAEGESDPVVTPEIGMDTELDTDVELDADVELDTDVELDVEAPDESVGEDDLAVAPLIDVTTVLAEGTAGDILDAIYLTAEINPELKQQIEGGTFGRDEILPEMVEMVFGTTEVEFDNAIVSAPMMSSIAYQVVVLQVAEGQDVEATKTIIADNADPVKWVCVEAEAVVIESIGNTIFFAMTDQETADACLTAFQALEQ